jgi:TPR repeat protein
MSSSVTNSAIRYRAATFHQTAAKKFGNFDAVVRLGNLHLQGSGVSRSAQDSLTYFNVANAVGPWAGWLRRGFNQYVQGRSAESAGNPFHRDHSGDYARALMAYLHSGEIGEAASLIPSHLSHHDPSRPIPLLSPWWAAAAVRLRSVSEQLGFHHSSETLRCDP